ncbi:streptococcal histidine triad protein PhpA [Streptococcus pneumoniae]|nr:streptococcal histidine triad protein PhpA [Streptococcus pneumoniae]
MTPPSTDHQDSGNTEAKGAEAIYNRVKAAKKVPLDRMPYNLQYTVETEKPNEEKPQTEKPEEETPREEKPQSEKPESPKPTDEPEEESPEESPEESEEPQVETEKVEEKLREAEDLLGKIQDPIIKSNAKETLTGLKNNLLFGTQDNNTIMAEAEKLLALLKESK